MKCSQYKILTVTKYYNNIRKQKTGDDRITKQYPQNSSTKQKLFFQKTKEQLIYFFVA